MVTHGAFLFEACVDSLFSAIQAEKGGAGRLELCSALSQGGMTPSYGMIKAVIDRVRIPVHVLIRPRAGDFCYTEDEIDVICEDIHMAGGNLKVHGIAFGALTPDGDIDLQLMTRIIGLCKRYEISITFHRAFDATRNAEKSLQTLLELGVPRVLTSGQRETVTEGLPLLEVLVGKSMRRISIMPGGGITEDNAASIVRALGVTELHGSARSAAGFGQSFVNDRITFAMLGTATLMVADCEKVRAIVKACEDAIRKSSS